MKKLPLSKIKIKINLSFLLWAILLFAILLEAAVLYKHLYLNPRRAAPAVAQTEAENPRVNFPIYEKVVKWLEDNASFSAPNYQLEKEGAGRDNPFVEYR